MLEMRNVKKTYVVGDIETRALDGISIAFREKEFVAILGASGSGKTTCLNMIGGLDRYDSGDMMIKGKSTKKFKDKEWDAYRNNSIGFVFQSYNLIMHLGIVANVELAMTLSGVSASEKHKRALDALEKVGLKDHLHKKPNQLSGGQMQRVAIARALANDPEILLCDEPTGALDSVTSVQILELIRDLSKDRLVIMVTHNRELAEEYADRIVQFTDGKIVSDNHPHEERPKEDMFDLRKTSMSFLTALKISLNNLMTKKGRTFLTAFASSIGIIGIATILSLSSGFKVQVDDFQRDALSEFPIIVSQNAMEINQDVISANIEQRNNRGINKEGAQTDRVYLYDPAANRILHQNVFTDEYLEYLDGINNSESICSSIGYTNIVSMNMMRKTDKGVISVGFADMMSQMSSGSGSSMSMGSMSSMGLSSYPKMLEPGAESFVEKYYQVLEGEYPKAVTDIVLLVDENNCVDYNILRSMGFETGENGNLLESIAFSDIIGMEMKIIPNNNYFEATEYGVYMPKPDLDAVYEMNGAITIKVCGIVKMKDDFDMGLLGVGFAYCDELAREVVEMNRDSDIVKAQQESKMSVMQPGVELGEEGQAQMVAYLGGSTTPFLIMIYPKDFTSKEKITEYLDTYNESREIEEKVIYTDLASMLSGMTGGIMDAITIVLIAFAAISLVVSLIMISIITYTSVIERTKEIGILKALGARKKDITRVFDAETCILGIFSGVLGVVIAYMLTFPINSIIYSMTELKNVAGLPLVYAVLLVVVSTVLTMLGGHVPARMASKKDAVEALRTE